MKKISFTVLLAFIALSLAAQIKISAPTLVNPENEDDNQMPNVLLDWDAVSGIGVITYEVQLDEDSSFPSPASFTTEFTSSEMENLFFGHEYNWRVRATDDNGTGDWSEVFKFTVFNEVILNKPNDGSDGLMPDALLKWKNKVGSISITGVDNFIYQVSFDDAFTDVYIESTVLAEDFVGESIIAVNCVELFFDTTYYWRVKAVHSLDESDWSEVRSFSTLSAPELVDPSDGATDQMLDAVISWEEITGAFEYKYQLCADPNFDPPCASVTVETYTATLQALMFGNTYYWRVNAMHTKDTSNWSGSRSFEVINTVLLSSPANGDTVDLFPVLEWEAQTGIEKYELQYGTSNSFDEPEIYYIDVPEASYKIIFSLEKEMEYFWRMRAIKDVDTTDWSATGNFYTPFPIGINDNLLQKENVRIYPNPSNGILKVELNPNEKSMIRISVMDLLGQKVFEEKASFEQGTQTEMIDLNFLENGLYILKLESGNKVYNEKIILDK
ncbi:MAG: T9SS type A sorting domain-containing protein [Chlorobi bacterium]|nr:T9SS type A sorting domain-containing protein [Chlorobiota bacterium]